MCVVWDLLTGKEVLQVASADGWDFPGDGRTFAARTTDGFLRLYRLPDGKESGRLPLEGQPPMHIRFEPSGCRLAGISERTLQIVDRATGQVAAVIPQPAKGKTLDWSTDGRWLAVGSEDHRIYVYDGLRYRLQSTLVGHEKAVLTVHFHPSENLLASASWDGTWRLWDAVSGKQWLIAPGRFMRFRADGGRLGFKSTTSVGLWEVTGGRVCRLLHHGAVGNSTWSEGEGPQEVTFSHDGRLLASAGSDGVRLWEAATGREVGHLPTARTGSAQFQPHGGGLATYGLTGLLYWPGHRRQSALSGDRLHLGPPQLLQPLRSFSWLRLGWDRQGQRLAFTDFHHQRARVVQVGQGATQTVLSDPLAQVHVVALSPEGNWVATAARFDPSVKVWETATGKLLATLPGSQPLAHVYQVAFSPDNQWLVVGSHSDYRWYRVGS